MVSTLPQHQDGAESQHHEDNSPEEEYEDWSDSPSEKQPQKRQTPKRQHKRSSHQPTRQHVPSSDYYSNFTGDPFMRPPRNETVPFTGAYGHSPGAYQPDSSPSYYSAPNNQSPAGYTSPFNYPGGPNGYFSGPPPTAMPYPNVQDPLLYSQPGGYNLSPNVQHPMGYADPGNFAPDSYDYTESPPSYPQYPTQAPGRASTQPTASRPPNRQKERPMRGNKADRQPRKRRPSVLKKERSSSDDQATMLLMGQVLKRLDDLQIKIDDKSQEVRSDQGRYREDRRLRSSSAMGQYGLDDTRSLDVERQESDHLLGIIHRLLEDRDREGYRDSYGRSPRKGIAALLEDRLGLHDRDGERTLVKHRNDQEIGEKLDAILELLARSELDKPRVQQQLAPDAYEARPDRPPAKPHASVASAESLQEPATPPSSQGFLRRRGSQGMPTGPGGRKRRDSQYDNVQPSNQARSRQYPPRVPEPDEQTDLEDDYFEGYETQELPLQRPLQTRRPSATQHTGRPERRRSQASADHERSDIHNTRMRPQERDQQRSKPSRYQYVEDDDGQESDDQVPIPTRAPMPYMNGHRTREAQPPLQPAPDPPLQSRRRGSVKFQLN